MRGSEALGEVLTAPPHRNRMRWRHPLVHTSRAVKAQQSHSTFPVPDSSCDWPLSLCVAAGGNLKSIHLGGNCIGEKAAVMLARLKRRKNGNSVWFGGAPKAAPKDEFASSDEDDEGDNPPSPCYGGTAERQQFFNGVSALSE